jgi:hypothetical protein
MQKQSRVDNRLVETSSVDFKTLARLDKVKFIDKRHVIWWQLGFEGRRIISESEFDQTVKTITYPVVDRNPTREALSKVDEDSKIKELSISMAECREKMDGNGFVEALSEFRKRMDELLMKEKSFTVWMENYVPIMLKNVNVSDYLGEANCFFSIKPLSHEIGWTNNPERVIRLFTETKFPLGLYNEPHIRGVTIDVKDGFLFYYPIVNGQAPSMYIQSSIKLQSGETALVCPVDPSKFYEKLINTQWSRGKRTQRKPVEMDLPKNGLKIVPYYEFSPQQNHVTVYPAKANAKGLDLPVIIRGNGSTGIPEVIGAGYFTFGVIDDQNEFDDKKESLHYWEFVDTKRTVIEHVLTKRLGLDFRK